MKRILRDLIVAFVFIAAFYGVTRAVKLMGKEKDTQVDTSEFSMDRQLADDYLTKRQYELAGQQFEKLAEADPHNGHAWFLMAESYHSVRVSCLQRLRRYRSRPERAWVKEWQERADNCGRLAIPAYEKAIEFRRFRDQSCLRLAALHASYDEVDSALEYLAAAIDRGFTSRRGIENDWQFRNMKDNEEFQALIKKEQQTIRRNGEAQMKYLQNFRGRKKQ